MLAMMKAFKGDGISSKRHECDGDIAMVCLMRLSLHHRVNGEADVHRYIATSKSGSDLYKSPGIASISFSKSCRIPDDVKSIRES